MSVSRRDFLVRSAAITTAFASLEHFAGSRSLGSVLHDRGLRPDGYGDLVADRSGILDLPSGFRYQIVSRVGDRMDDGFFVPGQPDGMATFPGESGRVILVRNHEINDNVVLGSAFGESNELFVKVPEDRMYDRGHSTKPCLGGTTTVVYNTRTQRVEKEFLSLAGTVNNCAGGRTPWGSWLTCEETTQKREAHFECDHGYVFEVPASATGLIKPVPLKAMGRFRHEACGVNPETSIVYLTEDVDDGLLYRFIPNRRQDLSGGGRLQAMVALDARSLDSRNWDKPGGVPVGTKLRIGWVDISNVESPADDLRKQGFALGAIKFARAEGAWFGDRTLYFACTTGGSAKLGQIWRYVPPPADIEGTPQEARSPGMLDLFVEPNDTGAMANADNITTATWGDLIVCEDIVEQTAGRKQHLLGITPLGNVYKLARNMQNRSEFAGCVFSPDGSTLFVNIQGSGLTLAITGPWRTA